VYNLNDEFSPLLVYSTLLFIIRHSVTINLPVFHGTGRNDFDAGKSISRAIGRDGP
jgi:hypothetical protein